MNRLRAAIIACLAMLLLPDAVPAAMEQRYVYFPQRQLVATPASVGLDFEEVRFTAEDGVRLHGWYLPGRPDSPLVLFFHGNAGNISHRVYNLQLLHKLGVSQFIFDYRGYGKSEGEPTEQGTYADGRGALSYLAGRGWAPSRIVFFGRSMGAAVALQLATEQPPAGLVMESPFTSLKQMGRHHYPLLHLLLGWLLEARYDNLEKIGKLDSPLLIFQGERDAIVPARMARSLFDRARQPKRLHLIAGAGHNDTLEHGGEPYRLAWKEFLRQVAAGN